MRRLELIRFAGQRPFHHVAQQLAEATRARKALRRQDAIELGAHMLLGDRSHVASMDTEGAESTDHRG